MLRDCPFCGAEVIAEYPTLTYLERRGLWNISHYCNHLSPAVSVCIDVYGKTKQECFDKWNGVYHEDETSESL